MLSHPGIQLGSSAAARLSVKDKQKKKKAPEVEVITSHRHMQRFKNILYKKLGIDEEFLHAMKTPVETTKIKTVVPDRYLRVPTLSQRNKVLMKSTGAMHSRGLRVPHFREHLREKHDPSRLVLWTDGSPSTFAVVYRYALLGPETWSPWKAFGFKSKGRKVMSGDMEDIAVIKAIAIAIEQARKFPGRFKSVSIYTDSQSTILSIRNKSGKPPAMYAIKKAKALKALGIEVALHWVPGHSKVRNHLTMRPS
jgi:ribonuclease HI